MLSLKIALIFLISSDKLILPINSGIKITNWTNLSFINDVIELPMASLAYA